ncbi:MAG: Stk1 family PASTA domain-containing Ser/Thr kinase [Actinobacteria bacterium]|nr:Stk1 family PASTA domain-containing Ser/Thr kinase [Actinomycetota bacterium]
MRGGIEADAVVDERYQVVAHLGSGGMAEVYCATDLQLGRKVALKVLHERFAEDEEFVERFKREASSAAGLQHQHLVAVYDRGEWDGTSYIAMEYVDGRTLKQIVAEEGPLEPARAVDLTVQILRAARFAHRRGVIHRDFKPQNVIVDDEGRAKVTDFGIARAGASDMTQTGSIMGTAQYLSPEQAQGHAVNARSDLYSIGIILYELLTGKVPFEADSAVTIALKQVSEAPVPPSQINRNVTPELESVVLRALMKDPQERFADADEFIAALEAAASRIPSAAAIAAAEAAAAALPGAAVLGAGVTAPAASSQPVTGVYPASPPPVYERERDVVVDAPPPRPSRRKRWPWLLLGALGLIGLIALLASALAPERVQVPNVVGSSISVATQRLQSEGFEVVPVRDNSDKPRNSVIGQDPGAGTTADEGSRVTITVSDGPSIVSVPAVVGDTRNAARRKLTAAGFEVEEERVASDSVPIDRVVSQSPDRGLAERGSVVTLGISSGPERLPVPDVTGRSEDAARAALQAFRVVVQEKEDDDADPGTVLAQKPARGRLPRGATVTLTVAVEPSQVSVPKVVGRSQNFATKRLSGAGFEVAVEEVEVDDPDEDGIVQEQSPAGGDKVERGSTVTITVGRFDAPQSPAPGTGTTTTPATPPPAPAQ